MALTASGTLTANTVSTVQIDHALTGPTVVNLGSASIWATFDGTTPVAGTTGYVVPAGASYTHPIAYDAKVTINLISTGAVAYNVQGV